MKHLALLSALAVLVVAGAVWLGTPTDASAPVGAETIAAETIAAETVTPAEPTAPAPLGECQEADPLSGETQLACCIDQCTRDKDCRFICGREFGGQCIQVNSCCRECACFGFAPTGMPS